MLFTESKIESAKLFEAIALIEKATKEELRSIGFVESIIEIAGRTPDRRDVYADGPYYGHGSLHQKPAELARAMVYLSDKEISSYIEIGSSKGSTLAIISSYLNRFNQTTSIGIDVLTRRTWAKLEASLNVKFHTVDSDSFKNQKFDLCFIDGNHGFEWVERDFENVGRFSKFCMFHDILDKHCPGVGRFYNQIKGDNSIEFSEPPYDTMGIGVIPL